MIVSLSLWAVLVASTITGTHIPETFLVVLWTVAISCVLSARAVARSVARRRPRFLQNTLIVGADVGQLLGRKVTQHPELGLRLVGFVDEDPKAMRRDRPRVTVLGTADEIRAIVDRHDVQRIIVAFSNETHRSQLELVDAVRDLDVQIDLVPRLFEAMGPTVGMHYVEGLPLVSLPTGRPSRLARATKRAIDLAGAAFALVVLSPVLLFIAWRVKRDSDGPVFFRQERLGQDGAVRAPEVPHDARRYRRRAAPRVRREHHGHVRGAQREQPVQARSRRRRDGRRHLARKWSLDELPQLINVLRGDMSLVGPRPCMAYESELFEVHHFDRFLVPAGMTGLWQVTARARTTFKEALDLDVAYARNWSLGLDLKLMLRTPFVLFRQRGRRDASRERRGRPHGRRRSRLLGPEPRAERRRQPQGGACLAVRLEPPCASPLGRRYPNARRTADTRRCWPTSSTPFSSRLRSRRTTRSRQPLTAGKHVWIEKPFASSSADALDLAGRAERRESCCRATRSCTARRS